MTPQAANCIKHILYAYPSDATMLKGVYKSLARSVWPFATIRHASLSPDPWTLTATTSEGIEVVKAWPEIVGVDDVAQAVDLILEGM